MSDFVLVTVKVLVTMEFEYSSSGGVSQQDARDRAKRDTNNQLERCPNAESWNIEHIRSETT